MGILESSGLFLSDARFVNDASEISYGTQLFIDRLSRYVESGVDSHAAAVWKYFTEAEQLRAKREQQSIAWFSGHFYVASFCTDGNLLSQWRAYSGAGAGGCSIGFQSSEMVRRATITGNTYPPSMGPFVTLQRVIYEPDQQAAFLDQLIAKVFALLNDRDTGTRYYLGNTLQSSVIPAIVSQIKSPVFAEEQEWRLVVQRSAGLRFRTQKGRIVPHLHCGFGRGEDGKDRLPISGIYVGPSEYSDLFRIAAGELLRSHGFNDSAVPIIDSEIPLRLS